MTIMKRVFILFSCWFLFVIFAKASNAQVNKSTSRTTREKATMQVEILSLMQDNVYLNKKIRNLENTLSRQERIQIELRDQIDTLHKQNFYLSGKLKEKIKDSDDLGKLIYQLKADKAQLEKSVKNNEAIASSLKEKDKQIKSCQEKIAGLEKEESILNNRFQVELKDKIDKLSKQNSSLIQKIEEKSKEAEESKKQISGLKAEKEEIAKSIKKNEVIVAGLKEKDKQTEEYKTKIASLEKENLALKNKTKVDLKEKVDELQKQNSSLIQKIEEKSKEAEESKKQISGLKAEKEGIAKSGRKNEEIISSLKDKDKLIEEYRIRIASLEKENSTLRNRPQVELKIKTERIDKQSTLPVVAKPEGNKGQDVLESQIKRLKERVVALSKEKAILESLLNRQAYDLKQPELARVNKKDLEKTIHLNLGFAYGMKERNKEAIIEYRKALQYAPDDLDIHYNLGYLLEKDKQYEEAIEEYKKALKNTQEDREIYYNLSVIYFTAMKDREAGRLYYQKYLKISTADKDVFSPVDKTPKRE